MDSGSVDVDDSQARVENGERGSCGVERLVDGDQLATAFRSQNVQNDLGLFGENHQGRIQNAT